MPRMVQGLSDVIRTHRISSPTDARMLELGAPNACNLCHLDRSLGWTLDELERGWGRALTLDDSWRRYYDGLDQPVGRAWLASETPQVRLVAVDAYARRRGRGAAPVLLDALLDPYAVNRMFAVLGWQRVFGAPPSARQYDPLASEDARRRQVREMKNRHLNSTSSEIQR